LWEGNIDRGYMGSPTKKEHKNDNSLLSYPAKAMLKKKRLQQKGYRVRLWILRFWVIHKKVGPIIKPVSH
jgi:hypothetical protein